jgi:PPM family protein phosphatase
MRIIPNNVQYIGTRNEQQDDFGFSDDLDLDFVAHGGVLAIVADGMGGLARGSEASRLAKQTMLEAYEAKPQEEPVPEALARALVAANKAVYALAQQNGQAGEIGTTLVAGVIFEGRLYWVSAGDSRIYLYRRGRMRQLSTDHDYAKELEQEVAVGKITAEEALTHPMRRALTSYLGLKALPQVSRSMRPLPLQEGDRVLLCSDGLYNALEEQEITELLSSDPREAAEAMITAVEKKNRRSQDNVTVAILACEAETDRAGYALSSERPTGIGVFEAVSLLLAFILGGLANFSPIQSDLKKPPVVSSSAPTVGFPASPPQCAPTEKREPQAPPPAVQQDNLQAPQKTKTTQERRKKPKHAPKNQSKEESR